MYKGRNGKIMERGKEIIYFYKDCFWEKLNIRNVHSYHDLKDGKTK